MKTLKISTLVLSALCMLSCAATIDVTDLKCEYQSEPLGLDSATPRFTWTYDGNDDAFRQKSVTLYLSDSESEVVSGQNCLYQTDEISAIPFIKADLGQILTSHTEYWWKVVVTAEDGQTYESPIASFETAKMSPADWKASWISDGGDKDTQPSPLFRKEFSLDKTVASARLYISGAGYYRAWINGEEVGDKVLEPGYTHFDKRMYYSTYDVTDLLVNGVNAISAVLGNGWYNIQTLAVWGFDEARWRDRPSLISELRICYTDGSVDVVGSDASWKCSTGAFLDNDIYGGDTYDATKVEDGWQKAGFNSSAWASAVLVDTPSALLQSEQFDPIRVCEEFEPVSFKKFSDRLYVYDFGQNMAGFATIRVKGQKGTKLTIRYTEAMTPAGRADASNIDVYFHRVENSAPLQPVEGEEFQMDTYILSGEGIEEYTPSFNYHGYQIIEVEGDAPFEMDENSATGLFVHTDFEKVGNFSCSNEELNKLYEMTMYSYLGNFHSIPTDCPQREKNGWTADAALAIDLALQNYDGIRNYEKWMKDFIDNIHPDGRISGIVPCHDDWGYADWIGPVWDAALFLIPEAMYNFYGDKSVLEMMYPTFRNYLEYLETRLDDEGLITYGIGDWLPYQTKTPTKFTTPCYCYKMNVLMDRFGDILGIEDNGLYAQRAAALKENINRVYFHPETASYSTATIPTYSLPLAFGLVPDGFEERVAANLVAKVRENNHKCDFGTIGTKTVLRMLTKYGYADDAFQMAVQPELPGWIYWVRQGLTTLPEQWAYNTAKGGASYNHVFLGDVVAWMKETILGLNFDAAHPGFAHFTVHPYFFEGLDWAEGDYDSVNGKISISWKKSGNKVNLYVDVPVNTTATIWTDEVHEVGAGHHHFTFGI